MSTAPAAGTRRCDVPRRCRAARAHGIAIVLGGDFLALPVHAGGALVVDLHAVHADVALAGFRIAGDDAGQRDETAAILRPALQNGKVEQREVVALDHFLAGRRSRQSWERTCPSRPAWVAFSLCPGGLAGDLTSMKARMRSAISSSESTSSASRMRRRCQTG